MKFIRASILTRLFSLLLAFHFFNICVDMPDASPDYIPEDLTINDQESFVELMAEAILGIENAIEEHDEPDATNAQNFEMCKDIKFYQGRHNLTSFERPFSVIFTNIPHTVDYSYLYYKEINPPPPKA